MSRSMALCQKNSPLPKEYHKTHHCLPSCTTYIAMTFITTILPTTLSPIQTPTCYSLLMILLLLNIINRCSPHTKYSKENERNYRMDDEMENNPQPYKIKTGNIQSSDKA